MLRESSLVTWSPQHLSVPLNTPPVSLTTPGDSVTTNTLAFQPTSWFWSSHYSSLIYLFHSVTVCLAVTVTTIQDLCPAKRRERGAPALTRVSPGQCFPTSARFLHGLGRRLSALHMVRGQLPCLTEWERWFLLGLCLQCRGVHRLHWFIRFVLGGGRIYYLLTSWSRPWTSCLECPPHLRLPAGVPLFSFTTFMFLKSH